MTKVSAMRSLLFKYSYIISGRKEMKYFDEFLKTADWTLDQKREFQFEKVKDFLFYCSESIPYYKRIFKNIGFDPRDFNSLSDLRQLPILTKSDITNNYDEFRPENTISNKVYAGSTGGSTGEPLKYYMSSECYERGVALMYRGWSYAGYNIGDKVLVFAGSSLVGNSSLYSKIVKWSRNQVSVSSYGVSEEDLYKILKLINTERPKFIRGYASSIFMLADFIESEKKELHHLPVSVFTTAEMLSIRQREVIERVFNCKVFNQYGLNDGGISAYEHTQFPGFLVDTERALMECVQFDGVDSLGQVGRLLATSFYNRDFPFLRYDTGDMGVLKRVTDNGGTERLVLSDLFGRQTDLIKLNGKVIGSPVLTVLMGKVDVLRYQIVKEASCLTFKIKKGSTYNQDSEYFIKKSIFEHLGECVIVFDYSGSFITSGNKNKFIINRDEEE